MKEQHYKSHVRIVPMFHIVTGLATIAVIIGKHYKSCTFIQRKSLFRFFAVVVVSLILLSLLWHSRRFAIRAQEQSYPARENFPSLYSLQVSHWIVVCGLDKSSAFVLQVVRYGLAKKAVEENLNMDTIKKSVKNWRSDFHRHKILNVEYYFNTLY